MSQKASTGCREAKGCHPQKTFIQDWVDFMLKPYRVEVVVEVEAEINLRLTFWAPMESFWGLCQLLLISPSKHPCLTKRVNH